MSNYNSPKYIEQAYVECAEGDEKVEPLKFRTKRAICPRCDGYGYHSNPSLDGFTQDWLDEAYGPDQDEFIQEYTRRGGIYDVLCEECNGDKIIDEIDEENTDPRLMKFYLDWMRSYYEGESISRQERMMGA